MIRSALKVGIVAAAILTTVGCSSAPEQSGVFVTRNAGTEWIAAPDLSAENAKVPDVYPPLEVTAVAVSPADPNLVLAGTGDDLYRTTDGGKSWEALAEKLPAAKGKAVAVQEIIFDPANPDTFYVTGVTSGYGKVLKSTDRGTTLKEVFTGSDPKVTTTALLLDPRAATLYVGDQAGSLYKSPDGGSTWQRIFTAANPISSLVSSGDALFAGTAGEGIYRSTNGGLSWQSVNGGLEGRRLTVWRIASGLGGVYAGTEAGVFVTRNGGVNWQPLGRPLPVGEDRIQALTIVGSNLFYATNAVVYRSPGAGESFVPVQLRLATNVFSLSASPKEPNTLYAGAGGSKLTFTDRYGGNSLGSKLAPPTLGR